MSPDPCRLRVPVLVMVPEPERVAVVLAEIVKVPELEIPLPSVIAGAAPSVPVGAIEKDPELEMLPATMPPPYVVLFKVPPGVPPLMVNAPVMLRVTFTFMVSVRVAFIVTLANKGVLTFKVAAPAIITSSPATGRMPPHLAGTLQLPEPVKVLIAEYPLIQNRDIHKIKSGAFMGYLNNC